MKLLKSYIKKHIPGIGAAALLALLLVGSFRLYHLPAAAVIYPLLLCALPVAIMAAVDFYRTLRTHRSLERIKTMTASMIRELPKPDGTLESDYQDIVTALRDEVLNAETLAAGREREMKDYYTTWAHQIKTPIASMRLKLENEDSPLCRQLSSDLLRIEQYVEMVMAFVRLDSETGDYVFAERDIDSVISQEISKFASEFIDRRIKLSYSATHMTAVTDDKWLGFVLGQLLSNALKYTAPGGTIEICAKGPKTICVSDTGAGISPEDLPRVFEKGYTGGNGRLYKGASGLGLYLCRRICENLNADITIDSEAGRGTTVSVKLGQYEQRPE